MENKLRLNTLLAIILLLITACTYGPEQQHAALTSHWFSHDGKQLFIAATQTRYQEATGISAFPNGGKARVLEQIFALFQLNTDTGQLTLVNSYPVPDSVWLGFTPYIWSINSQGPIVLFTGCHKGEQCYGPQNQRGFYQVNLHSNLLALASNPEPARSKQTEKLVASRYSDRLEVWSKTPHKLVHRFHLSLTDNGLMISSLNDLHQENEQ